MKAAKLTLTNDFHNTEATVLVRAGNISGNAYRRAERKLCGIKECTCGGVRGGLCNAFVCNARNALHVA